MLGPVSYIEEVAWSKLFPPISLQRVQLSGHHVERLSIGVTVHWHDRSCRQGASHDTEISFIVGDFRETLVRRAQVFLWGKHLLGVRRAHRSSIVVEIVRHRQTSCITLQAKSVQPAPGR
jgi:hypothetical protein